MSKGTRALSFTEIQTALTCPARHAFAYTGRLTGNRALRRRQIAPILSGGRAWGAGVAVWHTRRQVFRSPQTTIDDHLAAASESGLARIAAHGALRASYAADVATQRERGVHVDPAFQVERVDRLAEILDHHMRTAKRLENLTRLEGEFLVAIPSRTGRRSSTRYKLHGFLDGYTVDDAGHQWLVEFKLRNTLSGAMQATLSRQVRWSAWALMREQGGYAPIGVILDERLNEPPKPARIVKGRKKGTLAPSHAKEQLTTPESYVAVCKEFGEEPHEDVLEALRGRVWQQRHRIVLRPDEIREAGAELVSAARVIGDLDGGTLYPIRNAQPQLCRSCSFVDICADPEDELYIESLFEWTTPKRLADPVPEGVT